MVQQNKVHVILTIITSRPAPAATPSPVCDGPLVVLLSIGPFVNTTLSIGSSVDITGMFESSVGTLVITAPLFEPSVATAVLVGFSLVVLSAGPIVSTTASVDRFVGSFVNTRASVDVILSVGSADAATLVGRFVTRAASVGT